MLGEPLIVAGAGGFGRKVADIVERINFAAGKPLWDLRGIADDAPSILNLERLKRRDISYLGTINQVFNDGRPTSFISGVGNPVVRQAIAERFESAGYRPATLIDPAAMVGSDVEIGVGSVICSGAALDTNTHYGRHVQVGFNAIIGHDAVIGDYTSVSPLAAVSGDCVIGERVLLGVAAVVMLQRRVGDDVTVGANGCVANDIPSGAVVKGVPAR